MSCSASGHNWWDLPLADSFGLHHLYRTEPGTVTASTLRRPPRSGDLLAVPVRRLSLGQRMQGELTALLDPELVVLDEPTIGLDVVSKYAVTEFLAETNPSGAPPCCSPPTTSTTSSSCVSGC